MAGGCIGFALKATPLNDKPTAIGAALATTPKPPKAAPETCCIPADAETEYCAMDNDRYFVCIIYDNI